MRIKNDAFNFNYDLRGYARTFFVLLFYVGLTFSHTRVIQHVFFGIDRAVLKLKVRQKFKSFEKYVHLTYYLHEILLNNLL